MRNKKITRIVSMLLAVLFLVSTAVATVSADETNPFITDKSIEDYASKLSAMSYLEYMEKYASYFNGQAGTSTEEEIIDVTRFCEFADGSGNLIKIENGTWTLTTKAGDVYTSVDEAVEQGGFEKSELVYVEEFEGVPALYTPGVGSVTWSLNLEALGIATGLYSIELLYYPVMGKPASVEREFYINGKAPFYEAQALSVPKIWSAYRADSTALTATYVPGKGESATEIVAAATAAGLSCSVTDTGAILVEKPETVTQANAEFIERYGLRFFTTDANRNELRPTAVQTPEWATYEFRDSEGFFGNALGFVIEPDLDGVIDLTLEGVNEPMAIAQIVLAPYKDMGSYADYYADLLASVGTEEGKSYVKIEAEHTFHTSTNVVYPIEDRTSPLTSPADTTRTLLNAIGAEKWQTAGQWVEYQFSVDDAGMYEIYSRFKQSYLDGMYVCRRLSVFTEGYDTPEAYAAVYGNTAGYYNGVPFAEAAELRYDYGTGWQVGALSNGDDANNDGNADTYPMYFEKDVVYTLRFEVTLGSMSELVQKVEDILDSLNKDYLSILKLTGTNPDQYRDYDFSRLLPDVLVDMMNQSDALADVKNFLVNTAETASSYTGTCDQLVNLLDKMSHDEDEIAKNLDNFKSYVGNLGTFLTDAKTQPLQLDYLTVQPASVEPPKAAANFFQTFLHELRSFIQSFIRDYNSMGAMVTDDSMESINVWLAYGRDQSQVIRNLCTNEFTPSTNIAVDLKLVSGGTLLPSILAQMGPDVYLGLADATVINYAIRGALLSIEDQPGFEEAVEGNFIEAAMIQLEIADADGDVHTYGLPEAQSFQMMFVRIDILDSLNIEIPKTWEDIYVAQSILESNNMEIGLNTNYKIFLYQANGDLYADDGMRINLDSPKGLAAFEKMCNLFTQHSFPYNYSAANRFRTGEMPIILADYTGLYNQLKVFATEIDGKWLFVPIPGTVQKDGSINNTADSTITAVVMISGVSDKSNAWEFMKWYTGAECQSAYANEMVAIIGDSAKHPTANFNALEKMPWTYDEFIEVSKQFQNLSAIPNYPGSYYLGRHTDFAFLAAYNDNADPRTEILSYINEINNEITRKRQEFGLETLEIGQTLAEKRMDQALEAMNALASRYGDKYADAIEAAKYAIVNERIIQLQEVSSVFEEMLLAEWDGAEIEVLKVSGKTVIMPSYYINVGKQTAEKKDGGYDIAGLNEQQLVYFVSECLKTAADKLASYDK